MYLCTYCKHTYCKHIYSKHIYKYASTPKASTPTASVSTASTPTASTTEASTPTASVSTASTPTTSTLTTSTPTASTPKASTPTARSPTTSTPTTSTPTTSTPTTSTHLRRVQLLRAPRWAPTHSGSRALADPPRWPRPPSSGYRSGATAPRARKDAVAASDRAFERLVTLSEAVPRRRPNSSGGQAKRTGHRRRRSKRRGAACIARGGGQRQARDGALTAVGVMYHISDVMDFEHGVQNQARQLAVVVVVLHEHGAGWVLASTGTGAVGVLRPTISGSHSHVLVCMARQARLLATCTVMLAAMKHGTRYGAEMRPQARVDVQCSRCKDDLLGCAAGIIKYSIRGCRGTGYLPTLCLPVPVLYLDALHKCRIRQVHACAPSQPGMVRRGTATEVSARRGTQMVPRPVSGIARPPPVVPGRPKTPVVHRCPRSTARRETNGTCMRVAGVPWTDALGPPISGVIRDEMHTHAHRRHTTSWRPKPTGGLTMPRRRHLRHDRRRKEGHERMPSRDGHDARKSKCGPRPEHGRLLAT
ncbi:hypothetical protein RJ55_04462 [Drechmeria coniospora]|nr:hypothetical protein RJ55_04462 [Drechmeria coniospora]